jgi:hypothetical protein
MMDATPPVDFIDIEKWLDTHPTTTVRELNGNPLLKPLAEISSENLKEEVCWILELVPCQRVDVDMSECSPAEAYQFLATQLLDAQLVPPPTGW